MKKALIALILAGMLSMSLAEGASTTTDSGGSFIDAASLKVLFVKQDPYPAEPGGYVNLLFKVENQGAKKAENVVFELLPKYPFSLDPKASAVQELGTLSGGQDTDENAFVLKYKVRVDKNAMDGENEIDARYTYGTGAAYSEKTFNVTISDPSTDFDVIVQDSTAASTTLAVANIGTNTAYSVITKIPEQESFRVTGASANIMGNLDTGDYTLASFQITPSRAAGNTSFSKKENLAVEISYTDILGIRRTVQKAVRLNAAGTLNSTGGMQMRGGTATAQGTSSSGLTYIAIGIAGIVLVTLFFRFMKREKK